MKRTWTTLLTALVLVSGCVHQVPLTTEHALPIDPDLVGLWEWVDSAAQGDPDQDRMLILPWSETEYLAQYPLGDKGGIYRAYPVEIGGRLVIQAESLGTNLGLPYHGDRRVYPVLTCEIVEGILVISSLDTKVIDEKITDSAELREAFLAAKDRTDLFEPPIHFRRLDDQ